MEQPADGFATSIKWQKPDQFECDTEAGHLVDEQQVEMAAVEGGAVTATDRVGNDPSYLFMSECSELPSLSGGMFASEPLPGGETVERQNSDGLKGETDLERLHSAIESGEQTETADATAEQISNVGAKSDNPHPLGSSQNPIRIIQQGNKYTSMQELSPEQLRQIMQVNWVEYVVVLGTSNV